MRYRKAAPPLEGSSLQSPRRGVRHERGLDANGRELDSPTSFFIGVALDLNAPDLDRELRVLEWKVAAGSHFLLTQPLYAPEDMERAQSMLGSFPLPVIMGVLPLRSARHARFLRNEVPGIVTPPDVPDRTERAGEGAAAEGLAISCELLSAVAGSIAGANFNAPLERFGIVSETLGDISLPGPPPRAGSTGRSCGPPGQQRHVVPGGGGADPHPGQVGVQLQVQPWESSLQPAEHQVLHGVEAQRPQPNGVFTADRTSSSLKLSINRST